MILILQIGAMAFSIEHVSIDQANGKPVSGGHHIGNGNEAATLCDNIDNDAGRDSTGIRQRRLQKARGISDAWRRTLANRDSYDFFKHGEKRPRLSVKRLRHEINVILSAEVSSLSDNDVYAVVKSMLFLLFEAELHIRMLNLDCKRLKDLFERDVSVIREMHAKQNVPIAITNSILDTRLPPPRGPNAELGAIVDPPKWDGNPSNGTPAEPCWTVSSSAPPPTSPSNVVVPPPMPPILPPIPSVSMPDITKPPPPIPKIVPVPNPYQSISPPVQPPLPQVFPAEMSSPPCPSIPPWSPTRPPPASQGSLGNTTASTILHAALRPNTTFQCSGPFGPPINPPRGSFPQPPDGFDMPQRCYQIADQHSFTDSCRDRRSNYSASGHNAVDGRSDFQDRRCH
ncbi:hypothetical protein Y032_0120g932 [Ancylostoma ceylanicum]|uniref:Uncharacterized protein n=1 Tax=Ancylostoma ceylanicum TaxID=53326 RepID=A0A016TAR4_9BILA|nr:hypothetical protein Y032_0120g932 [Ancylostoma ceylanicum]